MTILDILDKHSIKFLFALIPMRNGQKGALDGQAHTNMIRGVLPQRVVKRTFGYHLFKDLSVEECSLLQNQVKQGQKFVASSDDVLVCAIDTNQFYILDVDHESFANHPFTKLLMEGSLHYKSMSKGFPKIFLRIRNHQFTSDNQLLAKVNGNVALELHTGRWSYCPANAQVFGSDILELTYDELLDGYSILKPSAFSTLSSLSSCDDAMTHTDNEDWDEKEERFESKLLKLLEVNPQWGTVYGNWITMGYLLKYEFSDNDNMGRHSFHFYSSRLPSITDQYGNIINGYNYDECDTKWNSLTLHSDVESHVNESFLDKLIDYHPRLLPASPKLEANVETILANIPSLINHFNITEFRRLLKGIDDDGYKLYKEMLLRFWKVDYSDEQWGNEEKEWKRTRPTRKHTFDMLKALLRETNRCFFDQLFPKDEKENYNEIKTEFEKYNFKLLSPPSYVYIKPNGEFEILRSVDFITKHLHLKCNIWNEHTHQIEKKAFIHLWMQDEHLKMYDQIVFNPQTNKEHFTVIQNGRVETHINLFKRLRCHVFVEEFPDDDPELLEEALAFFKRQLCADHDLFYEYMLKWMAFVVQRVGQKIGILPVFKSIQGTGKTLWWKWFSNYIIGTSYSHMEQDMNKLLGRFNSIVENKLFFVANEISFKDTKDEQNKLKSFISDYEISIEKKGIDSREQLNYMNYVCTTNNDLPFTITPDDRRFVGMEGKHVKRLSAEEKEKYIPMFDMRNNIHPNKQLIATFARFLLGIDISSFDPIEDRPKTDFYQESLESLCPDIVLFLYYYTTDGDGRKYNENVGRLHLYEEYATWHSRYGNQNYSKMSLSAFGRRIKKMEGVVFTPSRKYTLDISVLYQNLFKSYNLDVPVLFS